MGFSLRDLRFSIEKDKDIGYKGIIILLEKCCFFVFWGFRLRDIFLIGDKGIIMLFLLFVYLFMFDY